MSRIDKVEAKIFKIEGFRIIFNHPSGMVVRGDLWGRLQWDYKRVTRYECTVWEWVSKHFNRSILGLRLEFCMGMGQRFKGI